MASNPYRPPTTALEDRPPAPPSGIRKGWAVLLGWCALNFVISLYPLIQLVSKPPLYQVLLWALDGTILYGLWEFVQRKPIRHPALRVLYILLVLVVICRAGAAYYFISGGLWPWQGSVEQIVSLAVLLSIPVMLLTAYALWQHATQPPAPAPGRQEPQAGPS